MLTPATLQLIINDIFKIAKMDDLKISFKGQFRLEAIKEEYYVQYVGDSDVIHFFFEPDISHYTEQHYPPGCSYKAESEFNKIMWTAYYWLGVQYGLEISRWEDVDEDEFYTEHIVIYADQKLPDQLASLQLTNDYGLLE